MSQQKIAITGVTGLIGGEILRQHLIKTDDHIICFVRATDQDNARERILEVLEGVDLDASYMGRITPVISDITVRNFGVDEADLRSYLKGVVRLFHCAAYTYFTQSKGCYITNVWALRFLIDVMQKYAMDVNLIYFGSAASCGIVNKDCVTESDSPNRNREHFIPYTKSKMQAECFISNSSIANRTLILKPSMCFPDVGDREDLGYDAVWAINVLRRAKMLPLNPDAKTDTVPVSLIGESSMFLANNVKSGTFHISADVSHSMKWGDYIDCCRSINSDKNLMRYCTDEEWQDYLLSVPKFFRKQLIAASVYFPLINQNVTYSSKKIQAVWKDYYSYFKPVNNFLPSVMMMAERSDDDLNVLGNL